MKRIARSFLAVRKGEERLRAKHARETRVPQNERGLERKWLEVPHGQPGRVVNLADTETQGEVVQAGYVGEGVLIRWQISARQLI